jgi:hypothetical protein
MNFDSIGESVLKVIGDVGGFTATNESTVTTLYFEFTIALFLALGTVLFLYRVTPYIAGAILFFIKFCICVVVFSMTVHLFKHSKLVNLVFAALKIPFALFK